LIPLIDKAFRMSSKISLQKNTEFYT